MLDNIISCQLMQVRFQAYLPATGNLLKILGKKEGEADHADKSDFNNILPRFPRQPLGRLRPGPRHRGAKTQIQPGKKPADESGLAQGAKESQGQNTPVEAIEPQDIRWCGQPTLPPAPGKIDKQYQKSQQSNSLKFLQAPR